MKLCPECGSRYEARVDFCFKDGHQLVAGPAVSVPTEAQPSPTAASSETGPGASLSPAVVPDPATAPLPSALPDPTDAPVPSRFADMFDAPEPRFAVPLQSSVAVHEGNTQPIAAADAESLAPPIPLSVTPAAPAATAPLAPASDPKSEQLSAPTPLAPVSAPATTAPVAQAPAAPPISEPPQKRPLVRPPRPTPQRPAPLPAPTPERPAPSPPVSAGADAPIEPVQEPTPAVLPSPAPPATEEEPFEDKGGSNFGVLVGLAAAALGLVAAGAWWFSQGPPPAAPVTPVAVEPAPPLVPPTPAPAPAPAPVEEPEPAAVEEPVPEPPEEPAPASKRQPRRERTPIPPPEPAPAPAPAPEPAPSDATGPSPWGAEPEAATEGTLSISTTPAGAKIFLDERKIGRSPIDRQVAFGSHTIRVELSGHKSDAKTVNFTTDRLAVSFELRAEVKMGKVAVFGVPQSEVSIDGTFVGLIPLQTSLSEGTHAFTVKPPGGDSFSITKEVRFGPGGRPVTINLSAP